ncbi:IS5 family transposase [Roseisalinus antarcticus]|uniref:Transposase DDE domain protein n=1 Tax=Roseisalinus antarcticus TaxID=254357 RepID=A0A1Y5TW54_9RHOB|nr:IS5 family transposase [Roseisalinus antarcticus]SLN74845.1 Transposase DDE domain protein [Roseisalinus antarcticus]
MPKQPAFPGLRDAMKKKQTRRELFLSEMNVVVPWGRLLGLIEPHYPKTGRKGGRPAMPLETMLRVYFLQNWYALSDPMAEETLYDSEAMRRFAGIELGDDRIPDETTILNFRHLLEQKGLTEAIFADVNAHLADKGITLRSGTLVDVSRRTPSVRVSLRKIIDAPSSTKNKEKTRDPEMSSIKKGNDWYFGMKAHVGVDSRNGLVHSLETTTARVHDSQVWDGLLHGDETSVWADKGYVNAERAAEFAGPGKFWGVMRKAPVGGELHPLDDRINRLIAKVRAKVEHPFRVIKRQFGHVGTRYRGLAKNRAQLFTLFALGNLFMVRRKLVA